MSTLEKIRLAMGKRQGEIAAMVGVRVITVSTWENRWSDPNAGRILSYAKALRIKPRELVEILASEPRRQRMAETAVA